MVEGRFKRNYMNRPRFVINKNKNFNSYGKKRGSYYRPSVFVNRVPRQMSYRPSPLQVVETIQLAADYAKPVHSTYISFPMLGIGNSTRSGDRIKLRSLDLGGHFEVVESVSDAAVSMDLPTEGSSEIPRAAARTPRDHLSGRMTMFVVKDIRPLGQGQAYPTLSDVIHVPSAHGDTSSLIHDGIINPNNKQRWT